MKHLKGYLVLIPILIIALFTGCTGEMKKNDNNANDTTGAGITTKSAVNNRYDMTAELQRAAEMDKGLYRTDADGERVTPYNTNYITGNPSGNVIMQDNTSTKSGVNTNIGAAHNE